MIKKTLAAVLVAAAGLLATAQGYEIRVKVKGFENRNLILGYHYRASLHVKDTVQFNSSGTAMFKGSEALPGGVYLFYFPNGKYYDIMIDKEQHFTVESDTLDFLNNAKITGASEPALFFELQQFMEAQSKKAAAIQEQYKAAGDNEQLKKELSAKSIAVNDAVKARWKTIEESHSGTFLAAFVKAAQEVPVPQFDIPEQTANPDSVRYFKHMSFVQAHYFDNIDLTDERMLRTPFFQQKIEYYFNTALIQIPDTIAHAAIATIEKSRSNPEMFKYMLPTIFNMVNESKIMGMDAAMVAIAEKYYLSGETSWTTDEFLNNLRTRVTELKPALLGQTAHDLKMESPSGEFFRLHEIQAPITILAFYEPDCSHCKKEMPLLYNNVFLKYRNKGVQVFAVYNLVDKAQWNKFIDDNGMYEWINVYDPYQNTGFRRYFDIKSTPMIYILDRDKKIIGKRIDVEQLPGFLDHVLKNTPQ